MKLTQEQANAVGVKLTSLNVAECPRCKVNRKLENEIVEIRGWAGGGIQSGPDTFTSPAAMLYCPQCGSLELFSLVILGFIKSQEELEKEAAEANEETAEA